MLRTRLCHRHHFASWDYRAQFPRVLIAALIAVVGLAPLLGLNLSANAGTRVVKTSRDPLIVEARIDSPLTWLGSSRDYNAARAALVRQMRDAVDRHPQRVITLRLPDNYLQYDRLPGSVRQGIVKLSGDEAPKNFYERRLAAMLVDVLDRTRIERPPLMLSVLGLPIEGKSNDDGVTISNRNYRTVMDAMEVVVSPRLLLIRGGDAGAIIRNSSPNAFRYANGRPVLFKTNSGWRLAASTDGPAQGGEGAGVQANAAASLDPDKARPLSPIQQLMLAWGMAESAWDLNSSGIVDVDDLIMLILNWATYTHGGSGNTGGDTTGGDDTSGDDDTTSDDDDTTTPPPPSGPAAQWVNPPSQYTIGSGASISLQLLSSAPANAHVVFQTWSDAAEAIQGVHQDNSAPFVYPAGALSQVSAGGAELQALVRNENFQIVAIIRHNVAFVAPDPPPPGGDDGSGGDGSGDSGSDDGSGTTTPPPPPPPGDSTGVSPGADPNAPAPTAAITSMNTTGQAPFTVHVHALGTQLGVGEVITARYEWNFGDSNGAHNVLAGYNAAHTYDSPGSYTITLKVTNQAGKQATATTSITVQPPARTVYYVADNGNDANPGTSPSAPLRSIARVAQLMGSNKEFLFRRAGTYDSQSTLHINGNNIVIGAYGNGARPALRWTAGGQYTHLLVVAPTSQNITVENIELTSNITTTLNNTMVRGMQVRGTNITVRNCHFGKLSYAMNAEAGGANGWLSMNNTAGVLGAYYAWCQGADIVHVGNTVAGGVDEHNIRLGGTQRVLLAHNDLTNTSKSTIWCMLGDYCYVTGNKLRSGRFLAGPNFAYSSNGERARHIVFEANEIFNEGVILYSGAENISLRNNIIHRDGGEAFSIWGYISSYNRTCRNVSVLNNTVINNATAYGRFAKIGQDAHNIVIANNIYRAPSLNTQVGGANVYIDDNDLATHTFRNNLWSTPKTGTWPHFMLGYGKTVNEWAAFGECVGERYRAFTTTDMDAVSMEPVFNVATGEAMAGVLADFNGTLRPVSGTVSVGAIEVGP